jgi:hypothetical protein
MDASMEKFDQLFGSEHFIYELFKGIKFSPYLLKLIKYRHQTEE